MSDETSSARRVVKCPECGSSRVATISFGMPGWSPQLEEDLASGRVFLGGCCVGRDDPDRHCHECGHSWSAGPPRAGDP